MVAHGVSHGITSSPSPPREALLPLPPPPLGRGRGNKGGGGPANPGLTPWDTFFRPFGASSTGILPVAKQSQVALPGSGCRQG